MHFIRQPCTTSVRYALAFSSNAKWFHFKMCLNHKTQEMSRLANTSKNEYTFIFIFFYQHEEFRQYTSLKHKKVICQQTSSPECGQQKMLGEISLYREEMTVVDNWSLKIQRNLSPALINHKPVYIDILEFFLCSS